MYLFTHVSSKNMEHLLLARHCPGCWETTLATFIYTYGTGSERQVACQARDKAAASRDFKVCPKLEMVVRGQCSQNISNNLLAQHPTIGKTLSQTLSHLMHEILDLF